MNEVPDFFINNKTAFQLVHLLGVVIALCGAVMSDTIFFNSVGDSIITPNEIRYIKRGGHIVIFGLSIIIISGVFIFLSDVDKYLNSPKFLAKMTIVAVLTANGFLFHLSKRIELILSGAVSSASWISALVLGTLTAVPYSYETIMSMYILFLTISVIGALTLKNRLI
jgi:hypothetical protein